MKRSLRVQDVFDYLCDFAPPSLAETWDNVGLQAGSQRDKVRGVLVALDVTEEGLWEAAEHRANLLVTHHPLFFRPITALTDASPAMRQARLAVQLEINVLAFHTNLDATREGLNDQLAGMLRLARIKPLVPAPAGSPRGTGLGRLGSVAPTRLEPWLKKLARALGIAEFRCVGDPKHPVRKVAVMTGSGGSYVRQAKAAGADVLVTGDVKYHDALDALAEGIAVVDIGHWAGEIGMVSLVAGKLKKRFPRLPVRESRAGADPFRFVFVDHPA